MTQVLSLLYFGQQLISRTFGHAQKSSRKRSFWKGQIRP